MSERDPHPQHGATDRHRRGSTPTVPEPSEPRDAEGRSLPPHMHSPPKDVPVHHALHRPRSKRLLTPGVAKGPMDTVTPSPESGGPGTGETHGGLE
ncbi:hypothetical protein ANRL2_01001 [Anaerolineae bacterium]|nr:hypothetical protein ANRL2_01001 [Anaerolineae bacterium]